jgi:2-polyprenyl-3-methyl-5-hydroxy-6-metoxy-1,4-benzoquinol methylase
MARKSFKKGVKSIIDSIDNTAPKQAPKKDAHPKATEPLKTKAAISPKAKKSTVKKDISFNLGSKFTVQDVHAGITTLKEALNQTGRIIISSDVVTELDVSFMQILVAFEKAAKAKSLEINWQIKFSDDLMKIMQHSGMCEVLKNIIGETKEEVANA